MLTKTNSDYHNPYKPNYAPWPSFTRGEKLVGGAVVAGLLTAGALAVNTTKTDAGQIEREALAQLDKKVDSDQYHGFVIAKPGTVLRTSPLLEEQTIMKQLDKGEALLMTNPAVVDVDGERWLSFQFSDTEEGEGDKLEQAEEKTVWVDISTLIRETNSKGESFLEWYPIDRLHKQDQDISIDNNGILRDESGDKAGLASIMPLDQAHSIASTTKL